MMGLPKGGSERDYTRRMNALLGLLCVGTVVVLLVGTIGQWSSKVFRHVGESRRLRAWFDAHGTDFFDGVLSEDHPLYGPLATKLSYEPEPPGHLSKGTLWWAGAGTRAGRDFSFVAHSPSHPNVPNTWRVFVEGDTGLQGDDVLILCASSSAVFVNGPLAKRTLSAESAPGWGWAEVRGRGEGARTWLTPERSRLLEGWLHTGRALQVYPKFVVVVHHGGEAVRFIEQCLDGLQNVLSSQAHTAPDLGADTASPEVSGEVDEPLLRQRVDWSPGGGTQPWSEVTADPSRSRWSLRAAPDHTMKRIVGGMTAIGLVAGVLQHLEEGVSPVTMGIFAVSLAALNGYVWRDGWDLGSVGELDLEAQTFRTGKGQELASATDVICHDLSSARALQLVHSVSRRSDTNRDGAATQTVRSLHAYIVYADGTRIPLARFGRDAFWDLKLKVARVPELITDIQEASGWGLLKHL